MSSEKATTMVRPIFLSLVLFTALTPLWGQVEPSASGGEGVSDDDSAMAMPPQVSGGFYPTEVGGESKKNLVTAGVLFTAAYDNNLLAGLEAFPVSARSYIIEPNIGLSSSTARTNASLRYTAGFMFYDPTSELNDVTQDLVAEYSYRFTRHTIFDVEESFQQNSTVFSSPYLLAGFGISGSPDYVAPEFIAPYVGQILNSTSLRFGYQVSRSSMISASGYFSSFNYSKTGLAEGLYDSKSGGGSGSYARRLSRRQFLGVSYRYSASNTTPNDATTASQYSTAFYSITLPSHFSLSVSGGPEHTLTTVPGSKASDHWDPSGNASLGWQRVRQAYALTYSRAVTTGWGLLGAYTADAAVGVANWQLTPRLVAGITGNYSNTSQAGSIISTNTPLGHTIFGRATLQYKLAEHVNLEGEYGHLHQSISRVAVFANAPDDNRYAVSINYLFEKPLGR